MGVSSSPSVADDVLEPAPFAWILQRRRGFSRRQPSAGSSAAATPLGHDSRDDSRSNYSPPVSRGRPPLPRPRAAPSIPAPGTPSVAGSGDPMLSSARGLGGPGYFGPLGLVDTPLIAGVCGLQNYSDTGPLGSVPAIALPHLASAAAGRVSSGVSCGAGLTEAYPSPSPKPSDVVATASTASRRKFKGKCLAAVPPTKPSRRSKKSKGQARLKDTEDVTDDEDRDGDDRIMALLASGASAADIDRMYCCENMSAGDVERHFSSSGLAGL